MNPVGKIDGSLVRIGELTIDLDLISAIHKKSNKIEIYTRDTCHVIDIESVMRYRSTYYITEFAEELESLYKKLCEAWLNAKTRQQEQIKASGEQSGIILNNIFDFLTAQRHYEQTHADYDKLHK